MTMKNIIWLVFTVGLLVPYTYAQTIDLKINRAELSCGVDGVDPFASTIRFAFSKSLQANELMPCEKTDPECPAKQARLKAWIEGTLYNIENYHLMQVKDGTLVQLGGGETGDQVLDNTVSFFVLSNPTGAYRRYDLAESYVLVAKNVQFDGGTPVMIKVEPNSSCEQQPGNLPKGAKLPEEKEKDDFEKRKIEDYFAEPSVKESPVLKVDFSLQGSKKQQALYSFNVKFRPYTRRRLGFGGHYELSWFFLETEYKINAKQGDKKNVLNIGAFDFNWTKVLRDDGDENADEFFKHFPGIAFSVTPKLETEWKFKEMSSLISPKVMLPINLYQSRGSTIQLNPFAGIDIGPKFRSESLKRGQMNLRPFFGAGLTVNFLRKVDKPMLSLQVDYIRRLFLKPELAYAFDANGKEFPNRESKLPREHAKARFTFNATKFFSPFVEWEYGRVPPKYLLINYSFKSGIAFDVDFAWKTIAGK